MKEELTLRDVAASVDTVAKSVNDLADAVRVGFEQVDERFDRVETRLGGLETDVANLKTEMTGVKATMATKDFVERRLSKTDGKIVALATIMEKKRVITEEEKHAVLI